ncbi:hypothetical protein B0A48_17399 [Cryoendolithus antarcticus]|uniref:Heterokaryon incompatibility domain-containing protein n=1 Tax=Cryoendolithus antarcticus TaxID=1507870 RepID=A0A1V8SCP5_9PEZI|nr:hypothetical protein B0A48_17399 [Cryoendolithus antarcticus]
MSSDAPGELLLSDALALVACGQPGADELAQPHAIRYLERIPQTNALVLQTYRPDDQYVAISYTWPGSWTRLYSSDNPSMTLRNGVPTKSTHISVFMVKVFDDILASSAGERKPYLWVDFSCIDQDNELEKARQVAIMDRIYAQALYTAVVLEDVELSTEEHQLLLSPPIRDTSEERSRRLDVTRRLLRARWFKRAWCSQELILSADTFVYLHCTEQPAKPMRFPIGTLFNWTTIARTYDASIPELAQPRGSVNHTRLMSIAFNPSAWAYGIVREMGCYNEYDKIALVQNLVKTPLPKRLTHLPNTKGLNDATAKRNVARMLNVLAVQSGDFSLLQSGHTDASAQAQDEDNFGWISAPTAGDLIADAWHAKNFDVHRDPEAVITAAGLRLTGLITSVTSEELWTICRNEEHLTISVNDDARVVRPDWLQSNPDGTTFAVKYFDTGRDQFTREPALSRLRDVLYAIDEFDADHVWPTFMPADNWWITRGPEDGVRSSSRDTLRDRIKQEYDRPGTMHRTTANGIAFLHSGDLTSFRVLTLADGSRIVAQGNVKSLIGREIFQPHVMRLKTFGSIHIACNMMVLCDLQIGESGNVRSCIGHLRSFTMIAEESSRVVTITIR